MPKGTRLSVLRGMSWSRAFRLLGMFVISDQGSETIELKINMWVLIDFHNVETNYSRAIS